MTAYVVVALVPPGRGHDSGTSRLNSVVALQLGGSTSLGNSVPYNHVAPLYSYLSQLPFETVPSELLSSLLEDIQWHGIDTYETPTRRAHLHNRSGRLQTSLKPLQAGAGV